MEQSLEIPRRPQQALSIAQLMTEVRSLRAAIRRAEMHLDEELKSRVVVRLVPPAEVRL